MRPINADALIALVQDSTILGDGFKQAFCALVNGEPTIEPEPHWIPCSERLPDNDDSVLISNSHGVTKAWWNGRFWTSIAVKKYKTVTAWMPLPEPYEERRER